MSGWQAVSFYTRGTGYEDEARRLIESAAALNVPLKVYEYEPTGTWRGNLNFKSACILEAFEEFPGKDIVFVDADAVFRKWPALFDELSEKREHDLSAHFYAYSPQSGDREELLSGTLWIANEPAGWGLVRRWHAVGLRNPNFRHQMCLKMALAELGNEGKAIRVFRHPFAYTCIYDYHRAKKGQEPVIEHFQASRRLRKFVGFGWPLISSRRPDGSTFPMRIIKPAHAPEPRTPEEKKVLVEKRIIQIKERKLKNRAREIMKMRERAHRNGRP